MKEQWQNHQWEQNLPDNEFKALVIRMLNKLGKRTDEPREF